MDSCTFNLLPFNTIMSYCRLEVEYSSSTIAFCAANGIDWYYFAMMQQFLSQHTHPKLVFKVRKQTE